MFASRFDALLISILTSRQAFLSVGILITLCLMFHSGESVAELNPITSKNDKQATYLRNVAKKNYNVPVEFF